jgi:nitrate reductase molybdenum cofactor assembly chaperone NarJ/NarW
MRMTLRALSALLSYPSSALQSHIGEVITAIRKEGVLPQEAIERLDPLVRSVADGDLLDAQSDYSELFDRSRSLSLHLFEHVHGDSRERGQAMIDLAEQYVQGGVFLDSSELPDFVPVFLEYASCLPPAEAIEVIGQPVHVFAALAERLDKRQSPYAAIFHALVAIAGVRPDAATLAELQENAPVEDPSRIDEEWEEAPVSFSSGGAHEMGGPRASLRKSGHQTGPLKGRRDDE